MKRGFLNGPTAKLGIAIPSPLCRIGADCLSSSAPTPSVSSKSSQGNLPVKKDKIREYGKVYGRRQSNHGIALVVPENRPSTLNNEQGKLMNMVVTTLPVNAAPDEPITECFFFPGTKEVFTSIPGFPQPLMHPASPGCRVGATPGKGKGLFATRALKAGDLILSERPLLVAARGMPLLHPAGMTEEQFVKYSRTHLTTHVQVCIDRMRPASKAAFVALANSHPVDAFEPTLGIICTNGLGLDLSRGVTGDMGQYTAICKDISRLNHR
ncbi:hypothetical protein B0H11DRAFT_615823 [Mycena galericulata]|nr:hypothetical protein B0H11DRAFT_615823 [Mycena galericulata]